MSVLKCLNNTKYIVKALEENVMKIELNQSPPTHFDFMIFWRGLPFFFKFLVVFSYPIAIVCMFSDLVLMEIFANYPTKTLRHFQFWRILSAPYVSLGMLHYSIGMINLYYLMPALQKTYSTAFIVVDFLIQNLLIQLTFMLVVNIITDFTEALSWTYSCSLWNILIVYLVRVCHAEDKEMQVCCMPFKLRSRYYPLVMIVFFNILTLPFVQIDIYLAYLMAYIQVRLCGGTIVFCSAGCLQAVEKRLLKLFGNRQDIFLLESSHFKDYEETVKQSVFRERGERQPQVTNKIMNELHAHSDVDNRMDENVVVDSEQNNSV